MATRHRRTTLLIALLVAACESTPPLPSASQIAVEPSEGSSAPSQPATAAPPTPPPAHRIGIRVVDGRGEFFDRLTGERFVPRGANYLHLERDANGIVVDRLFADYDGDGRRGRPSGDARSRLHRGADRPRHLPGRLHRRPGRRPPRRLPREHRRLPAPGIRGRPAGPHPGERPSQAGRLRPAGRGHVLQRRSTATSTASTSRRSAWACSGSTGRP